MTPDTAPPSQALVTAPSAPATGAPAGPKDLAAMLRQQEAQIAAALPAHIKPERFTRVALTALRTTKGLAECTPASFLGCMMTSAQLGLEPNTPLGHAYLIPFKKECTFILGYKGMIDLARRNGVSVVARTVYANDRFSVDYGLDESIVHKPTLGDRGPAVAYYGIARWDGGHMVQLATLADIEERKGRAKASGNGPWKTDPDAMARKTVVRMMAPYLPLSVELATAVSNDERVINYDVTTSSILDVDGTEIDSETGEVLSGGADAEVAS